MHNKIKQGAIIIFFFKCVTRVFLFYLLYAHAWYLWLCSKEKFYKKKSKEKEKAKRIKKLLKWLQACFLTYVGVIGCNSLDDSHFQTNVIDNVENLSKFYLHITYFVFYTLTSCTHYTQIFVKLYTCDCVLSFMAIINLTSWCV